MKGSAAKLRSIASTLFRVLPGVRARLGNEPLAGTHGKPYEFTQDWFGHKIPQWQATLKKFKGRSGLRYLEVGVFEGRSLLWMLDNVLTDATATAVAVDVFTLDYRQRLEHNLAVGGAVERVRIIEGRGELVMKTLENDSFDVIYLDGGHAAWTVFQQAALAWLLLKDDGLLIFDDYQWRQGEFPKDLRPELAIDAFVASFDQQLEVLYTGTHDVIVRKRERSCHEYYCSPVADGFVYLWRERKLLTTGEQREIALTDGQRAALERLLLGSPAFAFQDVILEPAFRELVDRLQSAQ